MSDESDAGERGREREGEKERERERVSERGRSGTGSPKAFRCSLDPPTTSVSASQPSCWHKQPEFTNHQPTNHQPPSTFIICINQSLNHESSSASPLNTGSLSCIDREYLVLNPHRNSRLGSFAGDLAPLHTTSLCQQRKQHGS